MAREDQDLRSLKDYIPAYGPQGISWRLQAPAMLRWVPQPSSGVICCLSGICTTLIFIAIILIITMTRQGVEQTEQSLALKIRNISTNVNSRAQELSAGDSRVMEKVVALENSLMVLSDSKVPEIESLVKRILSNEVLGVLSSDIQRILGVVGRLTEELRHGNSSTDPLCGRGWVHFGLNCYFLSQRLRPWNTAKGDCEGKKAQLVVINGKEEMDFLRDLLQEQTTWIGLELTNDNWRWVDGTSYTVTQKFWAEGQPDGLYRYWFQEDKHCTVMRGDGWHDHRCSQSLPYICEKRV